ncbi:MAG: 4Fe-4S dicluster domain-containing protein [Planctomycetaceae bacterium]|jgi:2-oxoglutarate ferredoxin oxidoreductase subunit delta|nr:4Fe-4S dicluster domain-containing protein [Planctomycetaceae bacterium]
MKIREKNFKLHLSTTHQQIIKINPQVNVTDCTPFIRIDTDRCKSCWRCLYYCPKKVIGKVGSFWSKKAAVTNPESCTGCLACVKACPLGLIVAIRKNESES